MGEEIPVPLVIVADKNNFYLGTEEGNDIKIVSKPFNTLEEATTEKTKKEKKKPNA